MKTTTERNANQPAKMKEELMLEDLVRLEKRPDTVEEQYQDVLRRININKMDLDDDIYERSDISKYFKGKCIFLTGGGGFLGQLYIEKLLRYVLGRWVGFHRPKKRKKFKY